MRIDSNYKKFYPRITTGRVYTTEFAVRTFLANLPHLNFAKPSSGDAILGIVYVVLLYAIWGLLQGWASIVVLLLGSTGIILFTLGVLGLYIGGIF